MKHFLLDLAFAIAYDLARKSRSRRLFLWFEVRAQRRKDGRLVQQFREHKITFQQFAESLENRRREPE